MLQFKLQNGYIFYGGNLLSFIILTAWLVYFCYMFNDLLKRDKAVHTSISFFATILFIVLFNFMFVPWWGAPILVFLIGLLKEILDRLNVKKRLFDLSDLLADVIGVTTVSLCYLFSWIFSKGT